MGDADYDAFGDSRNIEKVTLHVPAELLSAAQSTVPWNRFGKIVEQGSIQEIDGVRYKLMAIVNGQLSTDDAIYDLSGRRVGKATKGMYIINGKKILK